LHQLGRAGHHALQQLQHRINAPAPITRNKTGQKFDPKKRAVLSPLVMLAHPLTQQLALRAAAYTQRPRKYFAFNAQKPLDKSTHELV
jgi:hypothetical protein